YPLSLPPRPTLFPYTTLFRSFSGTKIFRGLLCHSAGCVRIFARGYSMGGIEDPARARERGTGPPTAGSRRNLLRHLHALLHADGDRKSTRLNSSHRTISYAVF